VLRLYLALVNSGQRTQDGNYRCVGLQQPHSDCFIISQGLLSGRIVDLTTSTSPDLPILFHNNDKLLLQHEVPSCLLAAIYLVQIAPTLWTKALSWLPMWWGKRHRDSGAYHFFKLRRSLSCGVVLRRILRPRWLFVEIFEYEKGPLMVW
jgi:hypothetical protein